MRAELCLTQFLEVSTSWRGAQKYICLPLHLPSWHESQGSEEDIHWVSLSKLLVPVILKENRYLMFEMCTLGVPNFGKKLEVIAAHELSHQFDHAEFNGAPEKMGKG